MTSVKARNEQIIQSAHLLAKISAWMLVLGVMVPTALVMMGVNIEPERVALIAFVSVPFSGFMFWCGWRMLYRLQYD